MEIAGEGELCSLCERSLDCHAYPAALDAPHHDLLAVLVWIEPFVE